MVCSFPVGWVRQILRLDLIKDGRILRHSSRKARALSDKSSSQANLESASMQTAACKPTSLDLVYLRTRVCVERWNGSCMPHSIDPPPVPRRDRTKARRDSTSPTWRCVRVTPPSCRGRSRTDSTSRNKEGNVV